MQLETYPVEENQLTEFKARISQGESLKIEYLSDTLSSSGVTGCDKNRCIQLRNGLIDQLRKTTEERYGKENTLHAGCTQMYWQVSKWQDDWPDRRRHCESRVSLTVYAVAKI
ncbi:hypothetical protein [Sulfurimonas sp. HSL3-7]|uniref:hypothetical protein n=1 Tax=Sulfonitrofixus jiaomeiensis TaxID=3131938 RepID=UPI0031F9FB61